MKVLATRMVQFGRDLGRIGYVALALLGFTALFVAFVHAPLQERNRALHASLERHARAAAPAGPGASVGKLDSLYAYLEKSEAPTDWLAKLYGISQATGVELQSASYRTPGAEKPGAEKGSAADGKGAADGKAAGGRIQRYEIVVPVSGTYPQLREFMRRALAEIPVLSLDQLSLKRESRNAGAVQAELRMTLHMVKP
jgi:hypothetical protein